MPWVRFATTLLAAGVARTATATILDPVTEGDLVKGADLVFQGVVVAIDHRQSAVVTADDESLPHTFVTYQIERIFKGQVLSPTLTAATVTLRFLGGPDSTRQSTLEVGECPLFDLGDRDILFVRRNGRHICPLKGWQQGRFRIIGGELFSDEGHEVWLTPDQRMVYGDIHELEEVLTHPIGASVLRTVHDTDTAEEPPPPAPPMAGARLSPTTFAAFLDGLVAALHTPTELALLPPVESANPDVPFSLQTPHMVRPKAEAVTPRRSRGHLTGLRRAEEVLVQRFGPLLKGKPPRSKNNKR